MVSWWPGEGNASDVIDGNSGTLQGGATFATGRVGQAFSLNGSSAFVQVADAASLDITSAITIDAWVNPNACTRTFCAIVAKSDANGAGRAYGMWVRGTPVAPPAGTGALYVEGSGLGGATGFTAAGAIPNGVFTHVAAVITSGSGFALYVNGVLQTNLGSGVPTLAANSAPLTIGNSDPGFNFFFDGLIDEVEVFNRALSAAEIQAIVASRSNGKCTPTPTPTP